LKPRTVALPALVGFIWGACLRIVFHGAAKAPFMNGKRSGVREARVYAEIQVSCCPDSSNIRWRVHTVTGDWNAMTAPDTAETRGHDRKSQRNRRDVKNGSCMTFGVKWRPGSREMEVRCRGPD